MIWTIVYNGTEKTIADWGLSRLRRTRSNLSVDTVEFLADGRAVDASDLFAYESNIIIHRDRERSGNGFSGGKRWFYGRIEPWTRFGDGRGEHQAGTCVGPMWYLFNRVFRQSVKSFKGFSTPGDPTTEPTFEEKQFSHLVLNQAFDLVAHPNGRLNWREQIIEVLQYAIACGDPIAVGVITPTLDIPVEEVKNILCAEVLRKSYRWCLDATFWWDYTTEPYPTLHCKRHAELMPIAINLSAGRPLENIRLRERNDAMRPYVRIQYERETNGVLEVVDDVWPDPVPAGPPPGGLETTIDLKGFSSTKFAQRIVTAAIDINSLAWWKEKNKWMRDTTSIKSITLLNGASTLPLLKERDTGNAWNPVLTRELVTGAVADWMTGISTQRVTAEAYVDIEFKNGGKKRNERIHHDLVVTNAVSKVYTSTQINQVGESMPVGLAKEIYTSLHALSCEGSITLTDEEVPETLDFGQVINFVTPSRPAWANLNALIQEITDDTDEGRCSISFGSPEKFSARDLVELLRVARTRFNPSPSSLRQGTTGSTGATALPDKGGDGNSTSGAGSYQKHAVSGDADLEGKFWGVQHDATGARPLIAAGQFDAAGQIIPTSPSIKLDVAALPAGKQVALQPCNLSVGGVQKTVYVAATDAFTGGGGGSTVKLSLVAVWHDVLECLNSNGQTVYVLKSPKLRNSILNEIIQGVLYSYAYGASYVARASTGGGSVESQVITPRWLVNDEIWAEPIPTESRVKIPGSAPIAVDVAYIDVNRDGRAWSAEIAT